MIDPRTIILGDAARNLEDKLYEVKKCILESMREDPSLYDDVEYEEFTLILSKALLAQLDRATAF